MTDVRRMVCGTRGCSAYAKRRCKGCALLICEACWCVTHEGKPLADAVVKPFERRMSQADRNRLRR